MKKILGTGLTGLIGSRVQELLTDFEFQNISRSSGVDITDYKSLEEVIINSDADWVLHLAAKADVDGCEADKLAGVDGEAYKINVLGTQNISELCKKYSKKIIYISTDFVFDGQKPLGESYVETDKTHAIDWYGETKLLGEEKIKGSGVEYVILRVAYPYGNSIAQKKDFVRIIGKRLQEGKEIRGVTDHIICPTFIDDIAFGIRACVTNDAQGVYHLAGSTVLSPYDVALKIAKYVGASSNLVSQVTREEYFKDKAKRPLNLHLNNDKIKTLSVIPRTFDEGLGLITEF